MSDGEEPVVEPTLVSLHADDDWRLPAQKEYLWMSSFGAHMAALFVALDELLPYVPAASQDFTPYLARARNHDEAIDKAFSFRLAFLRRLNERLQGAGVNEDVVVDAGVAAKVSTSDGGVGRLSSELLERFEATFRRGRALQLSTCAGYTKRIRRDYPPNANDTVLLRLHPGTDIYPHELTTVFGYGRNLHERYELGDKLGEGNYGVVYKAVDRRTGAQYACKTIGKVPRGKNASSSHHLLKIRAEVDSMFRLGSSLDAVFLKDVFEDDGSVHLVMEVCEGGTLMESVNRKHLSEQYNASLMRSVLRFLAQCHSRGLVYRDVKPENFLFLTTDFDRTLKATDFGLMIRLPPREGAPEDASRHPCLMTGRYPYWPSMDFKAPTMKELFNIIANDPIDFSGLAAEGVSEQGQDFLKALLAKHPQDRLSAAEALEHPWIKEADSDDGAPLNGTVVQRLQRFAVSGQLKKVILNMITMDIISGTTDIFTSLETTQILAPARDIFMRLDQDASGDVSADELLLELSREGYTVSDHEVEQLMARIDADGDGRLVFDELASSLLDWNQFETSAQWLRLARRAFQRLDLNGDGHINLEEVISLLPSSQSQEERTEAARAMIREFDEDDDGNISWEEFLGLLTEGSTPAALDLFDKRLLHTGSSLGSSSDLELAPPAIETNNVVSASNLKRHCDEDVLMYYI
eukprot:jgi/Tetstr1/456162/TSEL_042930.t1